MAEAIIYMNDESIDQKTFDLLLNTIYQQYGYDFREYAQTSLKRRFAGILFRYNIATLKACQHRITQDPAFFTAVLSELTITVTELFRDPYAYVGIKGHVFPYLKTCPHFKIWHAGCATGEEVYSLAILLTEDELYERAIIYATDINLKALYDARLGLLSNEAIRQGTSNYFEAGGKASLSQYLISNNSHTLLSAQLKSHVVFSDHNLVSDSCFGEMQFVLCRNVMIYFNKELQARVLKLLTNSLCLGGYLCLGSKESLSFSSVEKQYERVDARARIYRKIRGESS